jgi:hypothetical protein
VPRSQKLAVHLPISVYLGWISLAIIANIASVLNTLIHGIPMSVQALWTVVLLGVVSVITILMVWNRRDFAFALVVVWASVGIAFNRVGVPAVFAASVVTATVATILIVATPFVKRIGFIKFYMLSS